MLILEILGLIFNGFYETVCGFLSVLPSIIELKDTMDIFTVKGLSTEAIVSLGVATIIASLIVYIIFKFKSTIL
jgi:hypothetical protein